MKTFFLTLVFISVSVLTTFSQKYELKISDNQITIPFGNSVVISSILEGNNISNHKFLFRSIIAETLDYNTRFNNIYFDNLPVKSIAFGFGKVKCCETETLSLVTKSNLGQDYSFKYKTVHQEIKYNSVGESNSKKLTSFTFEGIEANLEAIIIYDIKIIE